MTCTSRLQFAFLVAASLLMGGCALGSLSKTARYGFSPPLSEVIRSNKTAQAEAPLAQRYSYAWQNVEQDLAAGMQIDESKRIVAILPVPPKSALVTQAHKRAEGLSEHRKVNAELARTAKTRGDAAYHAEMATPRCS